MNKSGRNDPCPCGSGKKYKKCCLPRDESASPRIFQPEPEKHFIAELRPDVDDEVDQVLERLERGQLENVEAELKALLKANLDYHTTNFAMGVYRGQIENDPVGAMPFFERAVEIFPYFAEAQYNLGGCACQAVQLPKAISAYRAAIRYAGNDESMANLARNALEKIEKIVTSTGPYKNLDAYMENQSLFDRAFEDLTHKKTKSAIEGFLQVLAQNPTHVQSYGNLGLAYAQNGQKSLALECLDKALSLDPDYEPARFNRINIERMREGVPIGGIGIETEYYREKFEEKKSTPDSPPPRLSWWRKMARL